MIKLKCSKSHSLLYLYKNEKCLSNIANFMRYLVNIIGIIVLVYMKTVTHIDEPKRKRSTKIISLISVKSFHSDLLNEVFFLQSIQRKLFM